MNKETETIFIDDLNVNALTDDQVHKVYTELSSADKTN